MRSAIKHVAEAAIVWSGAARLSRRRMAGQTLVLAYHNVVPDDTPPVGDLPNHLPVSAFASQLEQLQATHDVVPLSEILTQSGATSTRPRAAITFDDAYRGAVVHGIGEVARRGLPATIFVTPAFLGGRSFWWDAVASTDGRGLNPEFRDRCLNELKGYDSLVREAAKGEGRDINSVTDVACAASEQELLTAARQIGVTLGSHTWGHPNLVTLSADELKEELTKPLAWLRSKVANPLPWLAYPYGFFNDVVERAAADAGYEAALAISGGWLTGSPASRYALPRLNIPRGLSARGFTLRGAGFLAG